MSTFWHVNGLQQTILLKRFVIILPFVRPGWFVVECLGFCVVLPCDTTAKYPEYQITSKQAGIGHGDPAKPSQNYKAPKKHLPRRPLNSHKQHVPSVGMSNSFLHFLKGWLTHSQLRRPKMTRKKWISEKSLYRAFTSMSQSILPDGLHRFSFKNIVAVQSVPRCFVRAFTTVTSP